MIKKVGVFPHPPIVIPEVGKEEWHKVIATYNAMEKLAKEFIAEGIKKMVVISPHGPVYSRMLTINVSNNLQGDLGDFNFHKTYVFKNNLELAEKFVQEGFYPVETPLDHGVLVPLYFFEKLDNSLEIVSISTGAISSEEIATNGGIINRLLNENSQFKADDFGVIVSADLSHKLKIDSYYGYAEEGPIFDKMVYDRIANGSFDSIKDIPLDIVRKAGQCGFNPLVLASFAIAGFHLKSKVLNYENPFGVGYLVGKGDVSNEQ